MKKTKFLLIPLVALFVLNNNAFAASGGLSVSAGNVYVGDSFTATVNVNAVAAWNVHVSASGPVSGCSINQADTTADAMNTNKSFSTTCTATGTGVITIVLSGDATSASDGNTVGLSGSRNVSVSERPAAPSDNGGNNNGGGSSNNNGSSNRSNNTPQPADNRSKNNNLSGLSVEGYDLVKVDNNNYSLSVLYDVASINVNATAEDSKSKVAGTGNHEINIGENNIEIIVTAENGSQNKINIKVVRKDGFYLEDLEYVLGNDKIDDANIIIKSDTNITASDFEKVKNSKKTVKFNYYNDDKLLVYSWVVDGSRLNDVNDLMTTVVNDTENKKDMLRLSNYADGMYVSLKQADNLPAGVKLKFFVGNKYEDGELVNIYAYIKDEDKLKLMSDKVEVKDGYIEFEVKGAYEYLVTMSTVPSSDKVITATGGGAAVPVLATMVVILALATAGLVTMLVVKNMKGKKVGHNNKKGHASDSDSGQTLIQ